MAGARAVPVQMWKWERPVPVQMRRCADATAALMCSFSHDAAQGSDGREGLLAHGDFETLLHELGHVVHNLLSRTEFQYLSGTCCNMQHTT